MESLKSKLLGKWEGTVHPEMGGYMQRLEFFAGGTVSTEISSFPAKIGIFSLKQVSENPFPILEVKFPEISDFVVPYIFKFEENSDLHLCCPFLTEKTPLSFEGPGHVVMRRSEISSPQSFQVQGALEDRVRRYLKESIEVLLRMEVIGNSFDSEITANKAAIAMISALTKIDSLAHKFGLDVLDYLEKHKKFPINTDIDSLYKLMTKIAREKGVTNESSLARNSPSTTVTSSPVVSPAAHSPIPRTPQGKSGGFFSRVPFSGGFFLTAAVAVAVSCWLYGLRKARLASSV